MVRAVMVLCTILVAILVGGAPAAATVKVVTSIKPIHSLVAGVMRGAGAPALLIKGASSPHTYSLRPSDARALQAADLVFWVGPELETFLAKPLHALVRRARIVALAEAAGVRLLAGRAAGLWTLHHQPAGEKEDEHPGADHRHRMNMHIWLDPRNAKAMVSAIGAALSDVDPPRAQLYAANARALQRRLDVLDQGLEQTLTPLRGRPYVVFHDAYRYLEARYGLTAVGAITVAPDRPPGARRLAEIRARIRNAGVDCVFVEPQFEPALARALVEGTGAKVGVLDPLGADLSPGPDAYFQLMRNLAHSLKDCLATPG